jgi:hypothetical protein
VNHGRTGAGLSVMLDWSMPKDIHPSEPRATREVFAGSNMYRDGEATTPSETSETGTGCG